MLTPQSRAAQHESTLFIRWLSFLIAKVNRSIHRARAESYGTVVVAVGIAAAVAGVDGSHPRSVLSYGSVHVPRPDQGGLLNRISMSPFRSICSEEKGICYAPTPRWPFFCFQHVPMLSPFRAPPLSLSPTAGAARASPPPDTQGSAYLF